MKPLRAPFAVAHRMPHDPVGVERWLAAGVTVFEADVQLASDGRILVSHYLPFLRVRGWVQHDGRRFRWRGGPPFDPTLADAVDRLPASAAVLLDPKEVVRARRAALADALADELPDRTRFAVSTDHDDALVTYRAAGFSTWRTVKDIAALHDVLDAGPLPDSGVSVRHSLLDEATTRRLHDCVDIVVAWTVNDSGRASELAGHGVDGITTDDPAVAEMVAARR